MIELWLPGRGVGKARPRFSKGGKIHTCDRYGKWKRNTIIHLIRLKIPPAPKPAYVKCTFINFLSSDADNLIGSVLDSLVQAEILCNDSSSHVIGCSGVFAKARKLKNQKAIVGIIVRIKSGKIEFLEQNFAALRGFVI